MRKILLTIFTLLLSTNLFASYLKDGNYVVEYRYVNYAVSPSVGLHKYTVMFSNKKVAQIVDMQTGKALSEQKAYGLEALKEALVSNNPKNITIYKKDGKIYKIKPKNSPYYAVFIDSIKKADTPLEPTTLKERELKQNYYKWLRSGIKNYTIRTQDSRFKSKYPEGVELTVQNGQIIKAKDIRSDKEIVSDKKYFFSVKQLFGVAKWGIKDAKIVYNAKYGYPSLIALKNGITLSSYALKVR